MNFVWIFHHQGVEMSFLNLKCKKMLCKLPSIKLSAFNPNFWIAKNDNLWRNPSRRNHLTLFLWCQAYKSNDKRVNFSWFYVTNFFPRFSDHGAEIHTERKVSCWKMTIRINWKMKEGLLFVLVVNPIFRNVQKIL